MAAASSESQRTRDTVVNISSEGTGEIREETTETELAEQENCHHRMGVCDNTQLIMNPMLDRAPPPPYQEHSDFYPPSAPTHPMPPFLPSSIYPSIPSRSSPPPTYSQIDLTSHHLPSANPHLPSQLGGSSYQIPSQLGLGGPTSHLPSQLGGARPKKLQPTNQQLTNKQMTAALRQAGLTNGQRIVNVRLKEEQEQEQEEMSGKGKGGVAIAIFVIMFFVLYLCLPYTPFSPWD